MYGLKEYIFLPFYSYWTGYKTAFQKSCLKILAALACWSLIGILFATQWYVQMTNAGQRITWVTTLTWALNTWGSWAVLSPVIFWLANKFRIEKTRFRRNFFIHLSAGILFSIIQFLLQAEAGQITTWANKEAIPFSVSFYNLVSKTFHLNLLTYWAIVGISHGIEYYRRSQEREKKAAQLESQLISAQLRALKAQIHPHFLFNTLNVISELIFIEPESAERMIARLGEFLRITLENTFADEVRLEQELSFLSKYIEIEKIRFGDRLEIEINVEAESMNAAVPTLMLQPLVENAVHHGITILPGTGRIEINIERKNEKLCLEIKDNGPGIENSVQIKNKEGIGLSNTRSRLDQLYGGNYNFEIYNPAEGGTCVSLQIPFRILQNEKQ